MSFNVASSQVSPVAQISLSVFGSLVTEIAAVDLPLGVSPDNQDVIFAPGDVASRPGLQRIFATPWGAASTTYGKSYVDPLGVIRNLWLDSAGNLWVENLSTAPGVYALLAKTTPGTYAKSLTAFGREYIAISDALHGQDIPLQYDGKNLDRLTQDGPGTAPTVTSVALPSTAMLATGVPPTVAISECDPAGAAFTGAPYTAINIFCAAGTGTAFVGGTAIVSGNSSGAMNGTYSIVAVYPSGTGLIVCSAYFPAGTALGFGGIVTFGSGTTMTRRNNLVTVTTTAPHQLQVGFQSQITGMTAAAVGGGIATITINNEDSPGVALVITSSAHGLVPGIFVSLTGITGSSVGGGITSSTRQGQIVTVVTSAPHNLAPGASITLAGSSTSSFDTTTVVTQVASANVLTYIQVDVDATGTGGTVTLNWPVPQTTTPTYYQVLAAPSPTAFQVQIDYPDGQWTGGTVTYAWDGTFFVASVPNTTSFTYKQYGPDASTSQVGTVTPYGLAAPGIHQVQLSFLTRQGFITAPSPPAIFIANGGQYLSVTNIAIGPSNVQARILQFTGTLGSYFFYIPTPAIENGQQVSTATQLEDNTSTSALLDFSDNTLFASIAVSEPGNNLANQIVLDSALGFSFFAGRLSAYGMRNRVQNLLNMGFDGGYVPSAPNYPTGWKVTPPIAPSTAALATGLHGTTGWGLFLSPGGDAGNIYQSAKSDAYGAPILHPNQTYRFRLWAIVDVADAGMSITVQLQSASIGYSSQVVFNGTAISPMGSWLEGALMLETLPTIPSDMLLIVSAASSAVAVNCVIDDMSLIYADQPYLDTVAYGSYVDNPEAFDGVTGKYGSADDTRKMMDFGIIRNTPYLLTQEPSGRLHEIVVNGVTEPAGWQVDEVGANCGALSTFSLTKSQADNASASGGEEWLSWASLSGARIFGGSQPWKISQEIQPDWAAINPAAAKTVWSLNDPVSRVIYFGLPAVNASAPSLIYPVNYRELDTPEQIFAGAPVHAAYGGRLVATDNTRKWTRWNLPMNGAALMYRDLNSLSLVLMGGNGLFPGMAAGHGNAYTLNPAFLTDDDYGLISPYYVTFAFPQSDQEQQYQLGATRKLVVYTTADAAGVGIMEITLFVNTLTNPWVLTGERTLASDPKFDLEWSGANCIGNRIFAKYASVPPTGTDNKFKLRRVMVALKLDPNMPVRGAAQ